jgi:Tol biopolymer transport system component
MTEPGSGSVADLRWLDDPQISPAGTHVAYVELRLDRSADTVAARIGVVGAAGGATRWLAGGDCPRWSPDGCRLAVIADGELSLVDVDSGVTEQLTDSADATGWAEEPAWSPDGTRLALTRTERTESPDGVRIDALAGFHRQRRQVQVVDRHGTPLWSVPEGSCHPQWSPDGSRLAYLTTGGRPELCWTEAGGGAVRVAGGAPTGEAWPTWRTAMGMPPT